MSPILPGLLVEYRRKHGLRQLDLAERIGFSQRAVSLWEAGKRDPGAFELSCIARALGTTMDALYLGAP